MIDKGTPQSPELLLREGLDIRRNALPKGDGRTAEAESALGSCLAALRRYDEAELLLVESYATLKAKRHKLTQKTLKQLIALYEAWGKPEKAAQYRPLLPKSDR